MIVFLFLGHFVLKELMSLRQKTARSKKRAKKNSGSKKKAFIRRVSHADYLCVTDLVGSPPADVLFKEGVV